MKISVIGDSISSYSGITSNIIDAAPSYYYPHSDYYEDGTGVDSVNKTWWKLAIQQLGTLVKVDSVGSSTVGNYYGTEQSRCMNQQSRVNNLGSASTSSSSHPDMVMIFGGFNDLLLSDASGYEQSYGSGYHIDRFVNNYSNLVRMIFERYSNSITVMCITPYRCGLLTHWNTSSYITRFNNCCSGIGTVVNHYRNYGYDCKLVDLHELNLNQTNHTADENDHPTSTGMQAIANKVVYVQQYGY